MNLARLRTAIARGALLTCVFHVACEEDGTRPIPPGPRYQNLNERTHVLNNLELSYNKRNDSRYDELLDANFTFFFDPGDVGGSVPAQWGRAEDVAETRKLFGQLEAPICLSIDLDVEFEDGVQWVEVVPDPDQFPGETWHRAEVFYDFTFKFEGDITLIPYTGSKAQFTLREVTDTNDGRKEWRLVQWRDLGGAGLREPAASVSVEQATWGRLKAIYR